MIPLPAYVCAKGPEGLTKTLDQLLDEREKGEDRGLSESRRDIGGEGHGDGGRRRARVGRPGARAGDDGQRARCLRGESTHI